MRFLVRLSSDLTRESLLETVRSLATEVGSSARNPKWTSYGALEIDVFSPTGADFDLFLAAVEPLSKLEFSKDLGAAAPHMTDDELFSEARRLFNEERYWECHEVLEGAWRRRGGKEKQLLQGVILVCAAFVHHQKQEDGVALGVLARAARQLSFPEQTYGGFDVPALGANVGEILESKRFREFRV